VAHLQENLEIDRRPQRHFEAAAMLQREARRRPCLLHCRLRTSRRSGRGDGPRRALVAEEQACLTPARKLCNVLTPSYPRMFTIALTLFGSPNHSPQSPLLHVENVSLRLLLQE
jgi:hypothetical protein